MRRLQLPALAIIAVLFAGAAAPSRAHAADERAAAQQFGYAAYRARLAIKAVAPEIRRRTGALGSPACLRALHGVPPRAERQALAIFTLGYVTALFGPPLPALQKLTQELDAVQTDDPALRSGRAAWRKVVGLLSRLSRLDDPCGALAAWKRAGYAKSAVPPYDAAAIKALDTDPTLDARFKRAARRMRALGVPKSAAHRFTGDPLFRGVFPKESLTGSSGSSGAGSAPPTKR